MTPAVDAVVRSELGAFGLELARVAGVVVVTPLLWQNVPKSIRAVMVLVLAGIAHGAGQVAPDVATSLPRLVPAILAEFAVGAAMGFVVRLAIAAAEVAGNAIAPLIGFGVAQLFDPSTGASDTVLTTLFRTMAVWLALLVGLHRVVIGALVASFTVLPAGAHLSPALSAPILLEMSALALATGVRLALPVMAVLFMVQIALGFISRAAPSMQIFSIGFAALLIVGGVVLVMALPDIGRELIVDFSYVGERIEVVLGAMGGQ